MSRIVPAPPTCAGFPDFALLATGAFYHPTKDVRIALREDLENWIEELGPVHDRNAVMDVLSACMGTPLEPFRLDAVDMECAAALISIAFSERVGASRFRITSRDTIGDEGGLIVTKSLRSYFAERYLHGKHPQRSHQCGFFVPGYLPSPDLPMEGKGYQASATLEIDDEGMEVWVRPPDLFVHSIAGRPPEMEWSQLIEQIGRHSVMEGFDRPLSSIGLRFLGNSEGIRLRTGSPESCIQFATLLQRNPVLIVRIDAEGARAPVYHVPLSPPGEGDSLSLPAFFASGSDRTDWLWLDSGMLPPLQINPQLKLAMSRWLLPHTAWIEDLPPEFP